MTKQSIRALATHLAAVLVLGLVVLLIALQIRDSHDVVDALPFLLLLLVALAVGWIVAWRRPRHPLGWILVAIPALFALSAPAELLAQSLHASAPRISVWFEWYVGDDSGSDTSWEWLPPVWLLLAQLPLRFPDGRLPSPRWRWFSWFTVAALVTASFGIGTVPTEVAPGVANPAHITGDGWVEAVGFSSLAVSFVGSIASLFVRYRRAGGTERAQIRWVLWAVAIAVTGLIINFFLPQMYERITTWGLLLYAFIPVCIGIAVLRYRLYEIDRIISRTASYAIVTLVVVGTYALVVLLITLLIPGKQDHTPPVVIALATLAAAAVFLPALRWIRRLIDRVFNRSQYDAERVVIAFGERIRNGADPHTAGIDLVGAVGETLQPSAIGIWLREDAR